jgi:hypothetical protein
VTPRPEPDRILSTYTLREERLPSEEEWTVARERATTLFGVRQIALRRGRLIAMFSRDVVNYATTRRQTARDLVDQLERHAKSLGLDPASPTGRLATARRAADLLDDLVRKGPAVEIVERLARADLGESVDVVAKSISSAKDVAQALATAPWDNFDRIRRLSGTYAVEAEKILSRLSAVARDDESPVTSLADALRDAASVACALLDRVIENETTRKPDPAPDSTSRQPDKVVPVPAGSRTVVSGGLDQVIAELRAFTEANPGTTIEVSWRVVQ